MRSTIKKITPILFFTWIFAVGFSSSIQAVPFDPKDLRPPAQNPHPPQTAADKKRVGFAEEAVKLLLSEKLPQEILEMEKVLAIKKINPSSFQNKNLACVKQPSCYKNDLAFTQELLDFRQNLGLILQTKHAHIIPYTWQNFQKNKNATPRESNASSEESKRMNPIYKSDEYVVHLYGKSSLAQGWEGWYHIDVILTEDQEGNLFLRRFYFVPMRDSGLPPGVEC